MIITWTGPPEVFGLPSPEDNQLRVVGAATLQPSVFLVIARSVFFDLLYSSPRFVRNVYRELFIASRKMLLNTRALTTLDLNGRLATMLLRQATKGTNQEQIVRLPITQEALAGWLGASRGRLNQAMQLFQQRGLISIDGQNITILDYPGLVRMSEEQTAEEV
jgi:CRP-like cAMP-binding protein